MPPDSNWVILTGEEMAKRALDTFCLLEEATGAVYWMVEPGLVQVGTAGAAAAASAAAAEAAVRYPVMIAPASNAAIEFAASPLGRFLLSVKDALRFKVAIWVQLNKKYDPRCLEKDARTLVLQLVERDGKCVVARGRAQSRDRLGGYFGDEEVVDRMLGRNVTPNNPVILPLWFGIVLLVWGNSLVCCSRLVAAVTFGFFMMHRVAGFGANSVDARALGEAHFGGLRRRRRRPRPRPRRRRRPRRSRT